MPEKGAAGCIVGRSRPHRANIGTWLAWEGRRQAMQCCARQPEHDGERSARTGSNQGSVSSCHPWLSSFVSLYSRWESCLPASSSRSFFLLLSLWPPLLYEKSHRWTTTTTTDKWRAASSEESGLRRIVVGGGQPGPMTKALQQRRRDQHFPFLPFLFVLHLGPRLSRASASAGGVGQCLLVDGGATDGTKDEASRCITVASRGLAKAPRSDGRKNRARNAM